MKDYIKQHITREQIIEYIEYLLKQVKQSYTKKLFEVVKLEQRELLGIIRFAWVFNTITDIERDKFYDTLYDYTH